MSKKPGHRVSLYALGKGRSRMPGILRDKIMDDIFTYIPNDDKQINSQG